MYAELGHDAGFIHDDTCTPDQLHHPRFLNALGKVLVGSAYDNLFDARVLQRQRRCGREGVVSFKLHHWPHKNAGRGKNLFQNWKLRK